MGIFRRKKREPKPQAHPTFTRLINLAVVGLILYMVATNINSGSLDQTSSDGKSCSSAKSPEAELDAHLQRLYIQAAEFTAVDRLRFVGNKEMVSNRTLGTGPALSCGQTLKYRLKILNYPDRKTDPAFTSLTGKEKTIRYGDIASEEAKLVQLMASGLNEGGFSDYVFPRSGLMHIFSPGTPLANDNAAAIAHLDVISTTPKPPQSSIPTTIIETHKSSSHALLRCGGTANFTIRLWTMDGKPSPLRLSTDTESRLSNSITLNAELGRGQLPYGIERAAEGLGLGAVRMVVMPPEFLSAFPRESDSLPHVILEETGQTLLAEITIAPPQGISQPVEALPTNSQTAPAEAAVDKSPDAATMAPSEPDSTPSPSTAQ